MDNKINKKFLRPQTFWYVDFDTLDVDQDRNFIIKRTVHRGSDKEIYYINHIVGYKGIYDVLMNYKGVSDITLNFYKTMAEHNNSEEE